MELNRQIILDCAFDVVTQDQALQWCDAALRSEKAGYITTVNVSILMMMRRDKRLKDFISGSALTVVDGLPIVWLSKFLNKVLPERVAGIDLCLKMTELAASEGKSVYLLGATDAVLHDTKRALLQQNPDLIIAGSDNGYFTDEQAVDRARAIRDSGADMVFVAMGVPRQEYFLDSYMAELGNVLAIGVGGSFDVISGQTKRAPEWVQKIGMEWFYRMIQEPKRLAKRYLVTNSTFIALSLKEILLRRA